MMEQYRKPEPAEWYNTDAGNKETLQTRVMNSPHRYAILGSNSERFSDKVYGETPFGVYNTDAGGKQFLSTHVRDSKVLYAASFSNSNRWSSTLKSAAPDVVYNTDVGRFETLSSSVDHSPIAYSNMKSKYRRLGPLQNASDAPDVEYNTDVASKASLVTSVKLSPVKYSIMKSPTKRFKDVTSSSTPHDIGPGKYDPPCMLDLRKSTSSLPLSSLRSMSTRFGAKEDPSKFLGGTWTAEKDTKKWQEKGTYFSKAEIRRPQYLPP